MSLSPTAHDLVYRRTVPDDAEPLLDLFRRVLAADGTGDRDLRTWHWRFGSAPLGHESCVAEVAGGGPIVAHVGGTPHATIWDGRLRRSIECVDHMVAPELRSGLRRSSVFATLKLHWFEQFCAADHDFLAWGFPSESDFRIGHRFAGYALARTVNVLLCPDSSGFGNPRGVVVATCPRFEPEATALWARCRDDIGCAVVRDAAHLNWRYADCPHQRYELLAARDALDGSLRGLCVLRRAGISDDVGMLMELLVPRGDRDAVDALLQQAAHWTARQRLGALVAWFPECTAEFELLQDLGFRVRATRMIMAARSWDPAIDLAAVRRRFYLSFGDMDAW